MKIILSVGHYEGAKGAVNDRFPKLNEYDVNKNIVDTMHDMMRGSEDYFKVEKVYGNLPLNKKIEYFNNDEHVFTAEDTALIELHFNAFNGYASNSSGHEILIPRARPESALLAGCLLNSFGSIGNINRGIKKIVKPERGWPLLEGTTFKYVCITEPMFIDSEEGERLLDDNFIYDLSEMYIEGIYDFLERVE